jgi:hypothetical protein
LETKAFFGEWKKSKGARQLNSMPNKPPADMTLAEVRAELQAVTGKPRGGRRCGADSMSS